MASLHERQQTENGPIYIELRWRENGKDKRKTIGLKKDLPKTKLATIKKRKELELKGEVSPAKKLQGELVRNFWEVYKADYKIKHAPSTYKNTCYTFKAHLLKFFGDLTLLEITKARLDDYVKMRANTIIDETGILTDSNRETINKHINHVKAFLNFAEQSNIIDYNPIANYKRLKVIEPEKCIYKDKELKKIYEKATYPHWAQLLANTGMRLGELMQLKWKDIDYDEKLLKIKSTGIKRDAQAGTKAERTKSGETRYVPLFDGTIEALGRFEQERQPDDIYLLPRYNSKSYSRAIKRDIKRAGFDGSAHNYRHTFCTMLIRMGLDSKTVQVLAGHSKLSVTEKYIRPIDVQEILAIANLNI